MTEPTLRARNLAVTMIAGHIHGWGGINMRDAEYIAVDILDDLLDDDAPEPRKMEAFLGEDPAASMLARIFAPDVYWEARCRKLEDEAERFRLVVDELSSECNDEFLRRRDRCMRLPGAHRRHDRDPAGAWEQAAHRLRNVLERHGFARSHAGRKDPYIVWMASGRDRGASERGEAPVERSYY